ncbi:MAG: hypothetical protein J1F35_06265 [Erysipelotrichales bacterium]|nr:hypothetical protein [Erysipelotrichales bacterium]
MIKRWIINKLYKLISFLDCKEFDKQKDQIVYDINLPEGIEIETDTGYKPITNFIYKRPFKNWIIKLENGYELEGADKHILFREDYSEVFIDELKIGDKILTNKGPSKVIHIENTRIKLCMGDISVEDENHRFYSNGILSHNSVVTGIYTLWKTLFNMDNNALILSKSGQAGVDLVKKIKDMYLYLPYHLKAGTLKWNQGGFSLDNNSSVKTESFSPTAGLGSTINTLVLDEFAWCPPNDVELFYENIIPTVTTMPNSNVCIMSTQNGFNKFYQIWNGAITGKNIYAPFKTDWFEVPNYNLETREWEPRTEEWKEMMIGVLGSEEAFYYQYGTQFSASDKCLISREKLVEIRENNILYKERGDDLENLTMLNPNNLHWNPEYDLSRLKEEFFILTIDLAEGGGNDYTIFQIFQITDKDRYQQVGYYRSNTTSLEDAAADFWLMCPQLFTQDHYIISIEWNTYGALFYQYLLQLNEETYRPEILNRFNIVEEFDLSCIAHYKKGTQEEIDINGRKSGRKEIPGIRFSHSNKVTACMLTKILIEKSELVLNDIVTISELENFEDKNGNGSYSASYGHDDLICACLQLPLLKNTPRYKNFIEDFEALKNIGTNNIQAIDYYSSVPSNPFNQFNY